MNGKVLKILNKNDNKTYDVIGHKITGDKKNDKLIINLGNGRSKDIKISDSKWIIIEPDFIYDVISKMSNGRKTGRKSPVENKTKQFKEMSNVKQKED
jgi:hypothetical protein